MNATEACAGLRPVANALGDASGEQPQLRHGQTHALREVADDRRDPPVNFRILRLRHGLRRIARQRDLVGEEIPGEIHHNGDGEPDVDSIAPAHRPSAHNQQRR